MRALRKQSQEKRFAAPVYRPGLRSADRRPEADRCFSDAVLPRAACPKGLPASEKHLKLHRTAPETLNTHFVTQR